MSYLDTVRDMDAPALEREIIAHNYHYWVRAQPLISDYDYDKLIELLRAKAPKSPVLDAVGMGGAIRDLELRARIKDVVERYPIPAHMEPGDEVQHDAPMLSLDKCYDEATLRSWFAKFTGEVVVSPKVDGMAISLKYRQGQLVLAATRGDGAKGETITANALRMVGVPTKIPANVLEVRGEAYMPQSIFKAHFIDKFANPRNLTAGALKQKDAAQSAAYKIHFFAYDVIGTEFATEVEKFEFLRAQGFTCVESRLCDAASLQTAYDDLVARRHTLDYETDGVVYRANLVAEQKKLGATAHHPRFAIAYKFQGDSGVSVLREVEWSVSRTGSVNPVGLVDPVELSGAVVGRVSLHNLAIMEKLGRDGVLYLGSEVVMMRRGGVIPNLEQVTKHGAVPVVIPKHCPDCGGPTYREADFLLAKHTDQCRVYQVQQLKFFTDTIEADGFGEKIVAALFDAGLVKTPTDYFRLRPEDMVGLERMGEKLATKLVDQLQAKRSMPAELFLRALNIDEMGKNVSGILARTYGDLAKIRAATADELATLHTIGPTIAQKVVEGLKLRAPLMDALLVYVTLVWPGELAAAAVATEGPLLGKTVLFTGAMDAMTRDDAQDLVLANGGKAASGVSKTLDYLILGDKDMPRYLTGWRSDKLKKAEKLISDGAGLQILSETDFLKLLGKV
jgi:DNA ligase (NAD+)